MSCKFFVCSGDYCEYTRNVDEMLDKFGRERDAIVDTLQNNTPELIDTLWKNRSPVSKDDHCLFRMGREQRQPLNRTHSLVNYYICPQCKNMRRLTDLSETDPGTPFMLECGAKTGHKLVYTEQQVFNPYLKLDKPANSEKKLGVNVPEISRLKADSFTSGILSQWCLLSLEKAVYVRPLHMAWVCQERGYQLTDYANIGTIDNFQNFSKYLDNNGNASPTAKANDKNPLDLEVVLGIIMQLVVAVKQMSRYQVAHSQPSTEALVFTTQPVSYMAGDEHVASPVTLWIDKWQGAGITCGKNRIYSGCPVAELELSQRNPHIPIEIFQAKDSEVIVYRIKRTIKSGYMFWYLQSLGLPVYCSSFNFYAFLIVLLCEKAFYVTFMKKLSDWWEKLWIVAEDANVMKQRIQDVHDSGRVTKDQVLNLLTGVHLRCDAIDLAWKEIKEMK